VVDDRDRAELPGERRPALLRHRADAVLVREVVLDQRPLRLGGESEGVRADRTFKWGFERPGSVVLSTPLSFAANVVGRERKI
jgi:hypothetical protein